MGGVALNGDPIKKEYILPTFEKYKKQILNNIFGIEKIEILGSAGKKPESSDIDLCIQTKLTLEQMTFLLASMKVETKLDKGFGLIYTKFPIYNEENQITNKSVQIDLILGNLDWLKFAYWSPSKTKYTAHHRSVLLAAIVRYLRGINATKTLCINWRTGVYEKTREKYIGRNGNIREKIIKKEFITDNIDVLINKLNIERKIKKNINWSKNDLFQSVEVLWEKVVDIFSKEEIRAIKEYCIPAIKNRGEKYIVPNFMKL